MQKFLIAVTFFTLNIFILNAEAQTGPLAPGYEILPQKLQADAETPLVLTSLAGPRFCLDMDAGDAQAKTVHMWQCTIGWNQKIWFDAMTSVKAKDKIRIRIGTLACLVSSQKSGVRASMAICGDQSADESWTMNNGQLKDNSGLCLTVLEPKNGAHVILQECVSNSENQQWRLEGMRAASKRNPSNFKGFKDPSGLGNYNFMGYLPEIVEEFRPRFTKRELTDEERAEIKSLTSQWSKFDPIEAVSNGYSMPPVIIPWKTLMRLSVLGESGDKHAMRAVMEAFSLLRDTGGNPRPGYLWTVGWNSTDFPNAENGEFAFYVAKSLANIWSAHYWQRHGADRVAGRAFTSCTSLGHTCMGYKFRFNSKSNIIDWVNNGKGDIDTESIADITFVPSTGTPAAREERFLGYLDGTFKGRVNANVYDEYFLALQAVYAEKTGRLALWDNVMLNRSVVYPAFTSKQELYMRETLKSRADADAWKKKFEAFMAKKETTTYEQGQIQRELINRSDADLLRFATKYSVWFSEFEPRLCAGKLETSKPCIEIRETIVKNRQKYAEDIAKTRAQMEKYKMEVEEKKAANEEAYRQALAKRAAERKTSFMDQLVDLAEGFAAAAAAGSEQVTVRKYDSAGNYLGSESMTRARAAGLGAQSK